MGNSLIYLSSTPPTIDTDVADAILEMTTSLLEMFGVFPLNIFLGASLLALGVGLFRELRHSA